MTSSVAPHTPRCPSDLRAPHKRGQRLHGLVRIPDFLGNPVGYRKILTRVLAHERDCKHAGPNMAPDNGANRRFQEQHGVVDLHELVFQPLDIFGAISVSDDDMRADPQLECVPAVELGKLADALLAAARNTRKRELPLKRDVEYGLHVELAAGERDR